MFKLFMWLGCPHTWICCLGATAAAKGSLDHGYSQASNDVRTW